MQRAAIYIRVSTDDQTEFSPDAQRRALLDYAKKNDYLIDSDYIFVDEGISARTAEKRPAFMQMISVAKIKPKPFDAILVHKFDRFARNREDGVVYKSLLRKDCEVKVISITEQLEDDKFSIILESMLEAMAEYYSLNLADEVRKGMFEKARRGEHIGKAPYGYKLVNRKLVPDKCEFEIIQEIFNMFVYQNRSISSIARYLNKNHIDTKTKGIWSVVTLRYILKNHIYVGKTRYNYHPSNSKKPNPEGDWLFANSDHEPAINEDLFDMAQVKLAEISALYPRNYDPSQLKSWLQRICICDKCSTTMTISTCNGGKYKMFRCSVAGKGACSIHNTFSAGKLEELVLSQIKKDINHETTTNIEKLTHAPIINKQDLLTRKAKELHEKLDLAQKAYFSKIDTLEEYGVNKKWLLDEKK